jgi:hypothetical protein
LAYKLYGLETISLHILPRFVVPWHGGSHTGTLDTAQNKREGTNKKVASASVGCMGKVQWLVHVNAVMNFGVQWKPGNFLFT